MALLPFAARAADVELAAGHSTLLKSPRPMAEVMVADPTIADVQNHGNNALSLVGKKPGSTTLRLFDSAHSVIAAYDIHVGYDLVEMRRALKNLLPDEVIGVEMVGDNVALTGTVSGADASDKAMRIIARMIGASVDAPAAAQPSALSLLQPSAGNAAAQVVPVLNLLKIAGGQQVMLRVRVGEIERSALKNLGVNISALSGSAKAGVGLATGAAGLAGFLVPTDVVGTDAAAGYGPGRFIFPADSSGVPLNTQGILTGRWQPNGPNGPTLAGVLQALERDGLFKLLAEPNLVAISGEEAQFLAGGEIPVPVPQSSNGTNAQITIQYKPYGVAIRFKPFVLSPTRINMNVQPEVSELDYANALRIQGFSIPAITTRRAATTVELAPGESFMIAGLIKDESRATIDQLPGIKELPILGALFRSTQFQRSETELVIAVTPYTVSPTNSADIRLPTDHFAPASDLDMYLYGALSARGHGSAPITKKETPSVEGPVGFMVD